MIRKLLDEFLQIEGVTTAALIGMDGFLIESAGTTPEDEEALAALGSSLMAFFSRAGTILDRGRARQFVLEHEESSIVFTQVSEDTLLAVIAGTRPGAGRLAYLLPKITPRVAAII
jgi:predicted regulator of Ras-like GTPase activity (Roadblock/LC7/MglB family)